MDTFQKMLIAHHFAKQISEICDLKAKKVIPKKFRPPKKKGEQLKLPFDYFVGKCPFSIITCIVGHTYKLYSVLYTCTCTCIRGCKIVYTCTQNTTTSINIKFATSIVPSYKDSIVAILSIQNSIILIQITQYNNFMLK